MPTASAAPPARRWCRSIWPSAPPVRRPWSRCANPGAFRPPRGPKIPYQVVLNVDAVHSLFFPIQWGRVENATDWTPVQFETGEFLVLDSGFYDKAVTNDANSACAAQIRVLDADGNLVAETPAIAPGTSAQLSMLERDTPYRVEVLADLGSVILTFH